MSVSLTRRALFPVAGLAALTTLAGCQSLSHIFPQGNASLSQSATDVANIAGAFKAVMPQLSTVTNLTSQASLVVTQAVNDLQTLAQNLAAAATTAVAVPIVLQVETDVNSVVNTLASYASSLPKVVAEALQAAAILLPVIEASVGLLGAKAMAPATSVAHARSVLASLH